jgi:hypothetical protein
LICFCVVGMQDGCGCCLQGKYEAVKLKKFWRRVGVDCDRGKGLMG